jgi:hypothetical protein
MATSPIIISPSPPPIVLTDQPPNTPISIPFAISYFIAGSTTATATWSNATVTPGTDFSVQNVPGFPYTLVSQATPWNFTVNINEPAGTYTTILTINTSLGAFTYPISVTIANTTAVTVTPTSLSFPATVIGDTSQAMGVGIVGGASPVEIATPSFSNPDFSIIGSSSPLPTLLYPGATITLDIVFTPSVSGIDVGTMTIPVGEGAFVVDLVGVGLVFIEQNALQGIDYVFLLGFGPTSDVQEIDSTNLNSELSQTLVFNGTLWDGVSSEKVIRRLQFYFEDLGVCTLTATATVQRYRDDGTIFLDVKKSVVTFGTPEATGMERSAFFDFQLAGEIIYVQIDREPDAGPCSIYQFVPFIEVKGEKVEAK